MPDKSAVKKQLLVKSIIERKLNSPLEMALEYIALEYYIFPVKYKDKIPLIAGGFRNSSNDPEQIKNWWIKWPNANIGLDCGKSDVVVIDIDPKNGGDVSWDDLRQEHDIDIDTITVSTGSGGNHYYYQMPEKRIGRIIGKLGAGIDLCGDNGYVVMPPSIHQNGKEYIYLK